MSDAQTHAAAADAVANPVPMQEGDLGPIMPVETADCASTALFRLLPPSFPNVPRPKWCNLMVEVTLGPETTLGSRYALVPIPHPTPVNLQ